MSFDKVVKILIENKIKLRPRGFYTKIVFTEAQEKEIINLYLSGTVGCQLANKFDVSYPTIWAVLKKYNVKIKPMGIPVHKNYRSTGISGFYKQYHFRSMNELSFIINYLERKNILFESGEKTSGIEYYDSNTNKTRTYYPDYITNNGFVIEIKPKRFWDNSEVISKAKAAKIYADKNNLKYRLVSYPVIIEPILEKYFDNEIKFSENGYEKFIRIYKKYLSN